jgi:hypothetical protein
LLHLSPGFRIGSQYLKKKSVGAYPFAQQFPHIIIVDKTTSFHDWGAGKLTGYTLRSGSCCQILEKGVAGAFEHSDISK